MNIKVLIVDDEQASIKYLQKLINWSSYGFELLPPASSGYEALEFCKKRMPDIVITDITMPVMSGVELACALRNLSDSVYILFYTAYSDFKYAQEAFKLGVRDYLLKDEISQTYLINKMLHLREIYIKERNINTTLFEHRIEKLFCNGTGMPPLNKMDDHVARMLSRQYYASIIERNEPIPFLMEEAGFQEPNVTDYNELSMLCKNTEKKDEHRYIISIGKNRYLFLHDTREGFSQSQRYQNFRLAISEIDEKLSAHMKESFSIFIFSGEKAVDVIYKKYIDSQSRFMHKYFFSNRRVFEIDELVNMRTQNIVDSSGILDFKRAVEELDEEDALSVLDSMFSKALKSKNMETIKVVSLESLRILKDRFRDLFDLSNEIEIELISWNSQKEWFSFESAINWIKATAKQMICAEKSNCYKNYSQNTLMAIEYIRKNYRRSDLSVDDIVNSTHICKSNLSVSFKKETGKSMIEFLTEYRISIAKQYIENGHKIFEAARLTGFSNSQYFCKVFRKIEGINPVEYKNENNIASKS